MITSLLIKDFILIDELEIEFDKGFNVITGETGAGKSLIINAIDLAFGARGSKELIKSDKNRALIEVTIKVKDSFGEFNRGIFEEQGIELFDNEIVLSREISESGSRSRINGVMVSQDTLRTIREMLIDIHSQHMTYTYIHPKHHIRLLDSYGTIENYEHTQYLNDYANLYSKYCNVTKQLDAAKNKTELTEQQIDFLKFQINEIEAARVNDIEEDTKLNNELAILSNSEKLKEFTYSGYWNLYGNENNILSTLGAVKSNISRAAEFDPSLAETESEIVNCLEILKDVSSRLRNYSEALDLDEERLNDMQLRIDTLDKLKRKYGVTLEKVLESYNSFVSELNSVEFSQDETQRLEAELAQIEVELTDSAKKLSDSRKNISYNLSKLLTEELEKLDMPKVQFAINFETVDFNSNGTDNVEFLISTNISEEPRPLAKIASGGEISRVMLAIKTIFANSDNINTIIFDEIDTGISGSACQAVADEIVSLAMSHQVISITHQPIIAAKAHKHFYVSKTQDETTQVSIHSLDEENHVKAIAMLASGDVTDDAMNFARQLVYN